MSPPSVNKAAHQEESVALSANCVYSNLRSRNMFVTIHNQEFTCDQQCLPEFPLTPATDCNV